MKYAIVERSLETEEVGMQTKNDDRFRLTIFTRPKRSRPAYSSKYATGLPMVMRRRTELMQYVPKWVRAHGGCLSRVQCHLDGESIGMTCWWSTQAPKDSCLSSRHGCTSENKLRDGRCCQLQVQNTSKTLVVRGLASLASLTRIKWAYDVGNGVQVLPTRGERCKHHDSCAGNSD